MERPLSHHDIKTIAQYLAGTNKDLNIAISELGFDPCLYEDGEVAYWLRREANLIYRRGVWKFR
jgi:hypothetical protein